MSHPKPPKPAKLIAGFFLKDRALAVDIAGALQAEFGPVEMISPWFGFDFTAYYEKEMGAPLARRMLVFRNLVEQTPPAAHQTGHQSDRGAPHPGRKTHGQHRSGGICCPERLVLATGKNFTHRIYIGHGIYADLTLDLPEGGFPHVAVDLPRLCRPAHD